MKLGDRTYYGIYDDLESYGLVVLDMGLDTSEGRYLVETNKRSGHDNVLYVLQSWKDNGYIRNFDMEVDEFESEIMVTVYN